MRASRWIMFMGCPLVFLAVGWCLAGATGGQRAVYRSALCQANLREIGHAIRQYAEDHNGRLPDANDQSVRPWRWWDQGLHQYVGDLRVFYCPEATPHHFPILHASEKTGEPRLESGETPLDVRGETLLLAVSGEVREIPLSELSAAEAREWSAKARGDRSPLLPVSWVRNDIGYGMNFRFSSVHADIEKFSLKRLLRPEKVVLVADSNHHLLRPTQAMWSQDAAPRHEGRSNFLFADGHVESLNPETNRHSRAGASGIMNSAHWIPEFSTP